MDKLRQHTLINLIKKYQNEGNNSPMYDQNFSKILTILEPDIQSMLQTYKSQYSPGEYDDIKAEADKTLFIILPKINLIEHSSPLPFIKQSIRNAVNSSLPKIKQLPSSLQIDNERSFDQWDTTNENVQKNPTAESAAEELRFKLFISYIEEKGFDSNEIKVIKLYYTNDFQFQRTQLEISKMIDLSEQKVQRILKKAKEHLKTYFRENKIKRKQNSANKKPKKARTNKKKSAPAKSAFDISKNYHDFDPDCFFVCKRYDQNHFVFQVKVSVNITFTGGNKMVAEIDPDSYPSDKTISVAQIQMEHSEFLSEDDLKYQKKVFQIANISFSPNFEAFVRHYAPKKTEKEMTTFLKSIGCCNKYRKYILRYKDNFLPEISPTK